MLCKSHNYVNGSIKQIKSIEFGVEDGKDICLYF